MDIAYLFGNVLPDVDLQHLNESEIIKIANPLINPCRIGAVKNWIIIFEIFLFSRFS